MNSSTFYKIAMKRSNALLALLLTSLLCLYTQKSLRIKLITHIIIILYLLDIFHITLFNAFYKCKKRSTPIEAEIQALPPVRIDAGQLQRIINGFEGVKIEDLDEESKLCIKVLRDKFNNYNLD